MAFAYYFEMPNFRFILFDYFEMPDFRFILIREKLKLFEFWVFKKICICHHVKNISFTCFSGHFIIPPV